MEPSPDAASHLEPDPFEDLGEEAVVTIVVRDGPLAGTAPTPSLAARLGEVGSASRSSDSYTVYQGPVEEAVVEIVEVERSAVTGSESARRRFLPGLHWFFKPRDNGAN